jgi:Arc/MetJ-type ribon-helix-helix transcriptional regulator
MKRITVSLPDELVDRIKSAAGGGGQVSSYVATALADYQERQDLENVLAAWRSETPIADDVLRQVSAELDAVGLAKSSTRCLTDDCSEPFRSMPKYRTHGRLAQCAD